MSQVSFTCVLGCICFKKLRKPSLTLLMAYFTRDIHPVVFCPILKTLEGVQTTKLLVKLSPSSFNACVLSMCLTVKFSTLMITMISVYLAIAFQVFNLVPMVLYFHLGIVFCNHAINLMVSNLFCQVLSLIQWWTMKVNCQRVIHTGELMLFS